MNICNFWIEQVRDYMIYSNLQFLPQQYPVGLILTNQKLRNKEINTINNFIASLINTLQSVYFRFLLMFTDVLGILYAHICADLDPHSIVGEKRGNVISGIPLSSKELIIWTTNSFFLYICSLTIFSQVLPRCNLDLSA